MERRDASIDATAVDDPAQSAQAVSDGRGRLSGLKSFDVLKVLAGIAAAAGLLLHLVGSIYHESYLRAWGLDAALFPKSADILIITGFESIVGLSLKLFPAALSNFLEILGLVFAVTIYWSILKTSSTDRSAPAWIRRLPKWIFVGVTRYIAVLAVTILAILIVVLVGYLMAIPVVIAETMGRQHAADELVIFSKGCAPAREPLCFELKRNSALAQGFLIESSPENIAFYDVAMQRARVTTRAGSEVLGLGAPSSAANASLAPSTAR